MGKENATDKIIRLAKERVDKKLKEKETCSLCFYLQDFTEDWCRLLSEEKSAESKACEFYV
mgnify:CR=1 FL=1